MERVTDDQFALVDGRIRHVPGGVDEYLRLLDARAEAKAEKPRAAARTASAADSPNARREKRREAALSRAEEYSLKKELASTERKLETACKKTEAIRAEMKATDPSDYQALLDDQARLELAEQQVAELEDSWVELSTRLHEGGQPQ